MKLRHMFAALVLVTAFFVHGNASWKRVFVKQIRFAPGRTTAIRHGTMRRTDYVDYRVDANAGQLMIVHLTARHGKGRFQVGAVKGPGPYKAANMVNDWQGTLPITGRHLIILYADSRRLDYTLEITIR
jgi:hypothetical protein